MTDLQSKLAQLNKTKLFCKDLYLGDWYIQSDYGYKTIRGLITDKENYFDVSIDSDFNVSIEGYLLYHGFDAWIEIDSNEQEIGFEIETIIKDDNYLEKLRKDLTNLIPKISEMVDAISEFTEQYKEAVKKNND